MALNGSLDDYSPAGALRVLSSTGKTGAVRFTGSAGCTAYLSDGQLYFARGADTDDALAAALVRPGRLTAEQWTAAVEEAGDSPRVGEILIAHGAISPDLLASVVLSVMYDPLITLFREGDGSFDFDEDTMHWIGPYRGFNVEAIVNEVRRRVRTVDEMSHLIPSISAWVTAKRSLPDGAAQVTLLREDWELITALAGPRTIGELASTLGRGQYSTAQIVYRLGRAGLLEVHPEPFSPLSDDPVHEPSAAERMAAATAREEVRETGLEVPADEPVSDVTDTSEPATDVTDRRDGGDGGESSEGWDAAWSAGNPFDHPPSDLDTDTGVSFGPSMNGASVGPEIAPDDASQLLPRRSSVREADPHDRWTHGVHVHDEPQAEPEPAATNGLDGINGFQDPVAAINGAPVVEQPAEPAPELDPNAAWLENLYAQFIDEPVETGKASKREALDVAFNAPEQGEGEKVGTLRRMVDALRRL